MAKNKMTTNFVCQECGYESLKYLGKCPECGNWNTFKEFKEARGKGEGERVKFGSGDVTPQRLSEVSLQKVDRINTGFIELNNVMGGGIVPGSLTLLSGDPGIGKSTLLLQVALNISSQLSVIGSQKSQPTVNSEQSTVNSVLYISAEESVEQVTLRAKRIASDLGDYHLDLIGLSDTDAAVDLIQSQKPSLVIIDSIQTMESERLEGLSGSVGQIRYGANKFLQVAKGMNIPVILVGHVTKEGMVAGPMMLSHMVDTVLFLEGERFTSTRIIRSLKNRFGPVDEVGVFLMEEKGMIEVSHPEMLFMTDRTQKVSGSVLSIIIEGTRPFLVEVQALTVTSYLPMPRRVASGFDGKRLELLLAVLQKHCDIKLGNQDVYVNIAGGLKVSDPAMDLAVCLAIVASLSNIASSDMVAVGEVGLLGEVRQVSMLDKRLAEAKKLGFSKVISSKIAPSVQKALEGLTK